MAPPGFRRGGPTPWDQERLAQLVGGSIRAFSFMDSEQTRGGVGGKGLQAQEGVGPGVSLRSTRTQRHPPVGGGNREQSAERVTGRTGPQPQHAQGEGGLVGHGAGARPVSLQGTEVRAWAWPSGVAPGDGCAAPEGCG